MIEDEGPCTVGRDIEWVSCNVTIDKEVYDKLSVRAKSEGITEDLYIAYVIYDSFREYGDNWIEFDIRGHELDELTMHLLRLTAIWIKQLPIDDKKKLLKTWNEILGIV